MAAETPQTNGNGNSTVKPQEGEVRFRCVLTNLKLDQTMRVKGFAIEPLEEGQQHLKQASGMDTIPVDSAVLTVALPGAWDVSKAERQLTDSGFDILLLLLSFTERSRVQPVKEGYERFDDDKWKSIGGGHRDFLSLGRVRGQQMGGLVGGVEGFIDRNLEKLMADEETGEQGITLALRFLCSNYAHDFIESQYVKTWTALEILAAKNCSSVSIIEDDTALRTLRSKLREELRATVRDETITSEQREMLMEKMRDVNRKAISRQVVEVTQQAFAAHPLLVPHRREVSSFADIRNQIAHEGITPIPSKQDERELGQARAHLHGLIERLVVALLGEAADMLDVDWRNHRYQG